MSLESWIRERLPQTFCAEWPEGNPAFCASLETAIRGQQLLVANRPRAHGTTCVLMAAALYAASEKLSPYVLLFGRDQWYASCLLYSLKQMAAEAGLWESVKPHRRPPHIARNEIELIQGGIIGCHSIFESVRGLRAEVQGQLVRPGMLLMDLGTRPRSVSQIVRLQESVKYVSKIRNGLSPCGLAEVYTYE